MELTSAPAAIAQAMPSNIGIPAHVRMMPAMIAQKVINVPTLRSIPPLMMTSVAAIASTPFTDVA